MKRSTVLVGASLLALEKLSRQRGNSAPSGTWTPSAWAEVLSSWRASSANPGNIGLVTWGARPDSLSWFFGRAPVGLLPAYAPYSPEKARAYASLRGDPPPIILIAKSVQHADGDRLQIEIWDGEHRAHAARMSGKATIPAYIGLPWWATDPSCLGG